MPNYVYRCRHCGQTESVFHGMSETPSPPCPTCGGLTEKIIGRPPTILRKNSEAITIAPSIEQHHCPSSCVLHQKHSHSAD